ncbi:hypothetical protein [Methylocystis suflitae]|uniref:hypothetical protein n=1 Tax=Methylocystis suflitae TaxID=2951405 RepID=UPI00210E9563|nr:hypothetical protein [Methylocystis suflitae]MCQ4189187.1 hypothetical protein [Methylocystis suflitae]
MKKAFWAGPDSALFGRVVLACNPRRGLESYCKLQVRVKTAACGEEKPYVNVKFLADPWMNIDYGVLPVYIDFDLSTAKKLRDDLKQSMDAAEAWERRCGNWSGSR